MVKPRMAARRLLARYALALLAACAHPVSASAQESRVPTVEEIIQRLKSPALTPEDLRGHAVTIEGQRPRAQASQSIDLEVNFEFDSAKLSPDARIVLDNLGEALADPALRDARIRIAGHTDARGSRAYNLNLSRQRAHSVADYLVRLHAVGAQRLTIEGFGFEQLLDPDHPESAVNRRVQITNLGS